jgi:hypothetical protein
MRVRTGRAMMRQSSRKRWIGEKLHLELARRDETANSAGGYTRIGGNVSVWVC